MCCDGVRLARRALCLLAMAALPWLLVGCGRKGEPLPPIRLIPKAATDLTVSQRGGELELRAKYPNVAVNGMALPSLQTVEVWLLREPAAVSAAGDVLEKTATEGTTTPAPAPPPLSEAAFQARARQVQALSGDELKGAVAGDRLWVRLPVPAPQPPPEPIAPTEPTVTEPSSRSASEQLTYALRFVSSGRETSAFSNRVAIVPLAPPEPPPVLGLAARADGVEITWSGAGPVGSRLYRRPVTQPLYGAPIATVEAGVESYLDSGARFGERYVYSVTALAASEPAVESQRIVEREIEYLDRFAPATPAGLLALAESDRIRLSWQSVAASDLAGYFVERSLAGGAFERLNQQPLATPSYVDSSAGRQERAYRVTAVDREANESAPSAAVTARLRAP